MRRLQEEAAVDKIKTPTKRWGIKLLTRVLRLTGATGEEGLPPVYAALAKGRSAAQDRNILQSAITTR